MYYFVKIMSRSRRFYYIHYCNIDYVILLKYIIISQRNSFIKRWKKWKRSRPLSSIDKCPPFSTSTDFWIIGTILNYPSMFHLQLKTVLTFKQKNIMSVDLSTVDAHMYCASFYVERIDLASKLRKCFWKWQWFFS